MVLIPSTLPDKFLNIVLMVVGGGITLPPHGSVAAWQRGSMAAWQHGSMAAWLRGECSQYASLTDQRKSISFNNISDTDLDADASPTQFLAGLETIGRLLDRSKEWACRGGGHSAVVAFTLLFPHAQQPQVLITAFPKFFKETSCCHVD